MAKRIVEESKVPPSGRGVCWRRCADRYCIRSELRVPAGQLRVRLECQSDEWPNELSRKARYLRLAGAFVGDAAQTVTASDRSFECQPGNFAFAWNAKVMNGQTNCRGKQGTSVWPGRLLATLRRPLLHQIGASSASRATSRSPGMPK